MQQPICISVIVILLIAAIIVESVEAAVGKVGRANLEKLDNTNIKQAIRLWTDIETRPEAEKLYGHISKWDTSGVTDFSRLFSFTQ